MAAVRLDTLTEVAGVSAATSDSDVRAWRGKLKEMVKRMWVSVGQHILIQSDPAKVTLGNLVSPPHDLESAREWYKDEFEERISLPTQDIM